VCGLVGLVVVCSGGFVLLRRFFVRAWGRGRGVVACW
jgi:hypothetical protein